MKREIRVERFGIRLRPVTLQDAEFIFQLRRTPELSRFIGQFSDDFDSHVAWLQRNLPRPDDYYFIIESIDGIPAGTIAIYDIREGRGNWGRWMIEKSVPAAPASAWLIFHVAFDLLGLHEVFSNTIIDNVRTVSFHDRCGAVRDRIDKGAMDIDGTAYDVVIHTIGKKQWPDVSAALLPAAQFAERLLTGPSR